MKEPPRGAVLVGGIAAIVIIAIALTCLSPGKLEKAVDTGVVQGAMMPEQKVATERSAVPEIDVSRMSENVDLCQSCHPVRGIPTSRKFNFSHLRHFTRDISCEACHKATGHHATTLVSMEACIACHTKERKPTNCSACHPTVSDATPYPKRPPHNEYPEPPAPK
jgi:hypothetical protein